MQGEENKMDKCCNDCVFYKPRQKGLSCGACDYPVPEWIKIGTSGGGFIGMETHEGTNCATFKSRAEIINEPTA